MGEKKPLENNVVWRAVHKFIGGFVTVCLMLTTLLVFATVLMRYVFRVNIYGSDELITVTAMWLYFLGAVYGSYEESHIKGDLLTAFFKKKYHYKIHQIYVYIFCVFLLAIWSKWGLDYALTCLRSTRVTTGWKIPFWVNQLPISIGIIGMFLYSLYHLIRNIFKKSENYLMANEQRTAELAEAGKEAGEE
ncbi:MAG: TRAP transporter small permease [Oscillospiraceae bacterium]